MKINEKNLIYFATSNTPIDKQGWLLKRGEVNKSFQKRWFVLKGNLLFYFEKKNSQEPVGVVILEGCTIELAENEEQYTFKVVFHGTGGRTYLLGADTQESMESWMKALACASYDYMKLMVSELQRQLDELTALQQQSAHTFNTNQMPIPPPRQHHRPRRTNPFNRCQSEEDVEKLGAASSKIDQCGPHSVPNTPTPIRPAPPPPIQALPPTNLQSNFTHSELQTSSESVASSTVSKKSFVDLHDEYGQKIRKYLAGRSESSNSSTHTESLTNLN